LLALALLPLVSLKFFKELPAVLEVAHGFPRVAALVASSPADEVLDLPIADSLV